MSISKPQCREGVSLDLNPVCLLSHLPLLGGEGEEWRVPHESVDGPHRMSRSCGAGGLFPSTVLSAAGTPP